MACFPHSGDLEMWLRFASRGKIGVVNAVQAYYRWHSQNMSSSAYEKKLLDRKQFRDACTYVLDHHLKGYSEVTCWRRQCNVTLKNEAFDSARLALSGLAWEEARLWIEYIRAEWPSSKYTWALWMLILRFKLGPQLFSRLREMAGKGPKFEIESTGDRQVFCDGMEFGWWPE